MNGNFDGATALAQLKALEQQIMNSGANAGGNGFAAAPVVAAATATSGQPTGMLVPVTVKTPAGEVTVQVAFGPEACANPGQFILGLLNQGWPVKAYQPRQDFGGGGGGGGGFGRGGFGGGGGFRGGRY